MRSWLQDFSTFCKNKLYIVALSLTAAGAYGFMVTHETIGIDDTPSLYYFQDGLAAIVGRWVMYLVNKVVRIADFTPFLTDFAGVLILMLAVTVWCVLFRRIFGDMIPLWGYILFSCLFLSNPLISEVYTYYLHNGIATGYLFLGISLCCFWEGIVRRDEGSSFKKMIVPMVYSSLCLWIALGCYESFMIVYLVGICIVLFSSRMNKKCKKVFSALLIAAMIGIVAIILRSLMIALVTFVFGLQELKDAAIQRSITEMVGWLLEPEAFSEFGMVLKRIYLMYGVFGFAYYPIAVYVLSSIVVVVMAIWNTIRKKDGWIIILALGSFVASYLLIIIEGKATLYRSAQFLPMFSAWGLLLLILGIQNVCNMKIGKLKFSFLNPTLCIILSIILCNQCAEMNKWFYVDYLKYEDAKNTMNLIAYQLDKEFDTSKPVVFTGTYEMPNSILKDTYIPYNSPAFYKMVRWSSLAGEHVLEKFYRQNGVWVAQTPALSILDWGRYAFGTDEELIRFFGMHGHKLVPLLDTEYAPAEELSLELPSFPARGSIVDVGEYIIVHF